MEKQNEEKEMFSVTKFKMSFVEKDRNDVDCEGFDNMDDARAQFKKWRDEELKEQEERGSQYDIWSDDDHFYITSKDKKEMFHIFISDGLSIKFLKKKK